jgi:hypothetical protein
MTNTPTSPNAAADAQAAGAAVLRMIQGLHISRAVYVAARLGIADLLAAGPRPSVELAQLMRPPFTGSSDCWPRSMFSASSRPDILGLRRSGSGCAPTFPDRFATGRH